MVVTDTGADELGNRQTIARYDIIVYVKKSDHLIIIGLMTSLNKKFLKSRCSNLMIFSDMLHAQKLTIPSVILIFPNWTLW